MRRPDKTELEFFLLMVLLVVPFAWVVIRTVLALIGGLVAVLCSRVLIDQLAGVLDELLRVFDAVPQSPLKDP